MKKKKTKVKRSANSASKKDTSAATSQGRADLNESIYTYYTERTDNSDQGQPPKIDVTEVLAALDVDEAESAQLNAEEVQRLIQKDQEVEEEKKQDEEG